MKELWDKLQHEYRDGTIKKADEKLYKKWGNAMQKLSQDPLYPSLNTHEIPPLTKRYGVRVGNHIWKTKQVTQNECIGHTAQDDRK